MAPELCLPLRPSPFSFTWWPQRLVDTWTQQQLMLGKGPMETPWLPVLLHLFRKALQTHGARARERQVELKHGRALVAKTSTLSSRLACVASRPPRPASIGGVVIPLQATKKSRGAPGRVGWPRRHQHRDSFPGKGSTETRGRRHLR